MVITSIYNSSKCRVMIAYASLVMAWGRGNYAHFCRYKPILT